MSEHLALPFFEREFERKKRPAPQKLTPHGNRKEFSDVQIFKLGEIKEEFKQQREKVKRFLDPKLIFKVDLNQKVNETEFIEFLRRSGISVISPSPSGTGYWVLLADDIELSSLNERLAAYGQAEKYKEFDAIQSFSSIPSTEKIGEQLKTWPLSNTEEAYLDVEVWRMDTSKIDAFLAGFHTMLSSNDCSITDTIITENLCLVRIKTRKTVLDQILELKEISHIDRPPKPYLDLGLLSVPYDNLNVEIPPSADSAAIAIMDSGILSNHPLLEKAVGDEIAFTTNNGLISSDKPSDDVGHGTKIAGVALYGDLKSCIDSKSFKPDVWLLSAKIMYASPNPVTGEIEAKYDESELLEHQLEKAVRWAIAVKKNCRIINISFGNSYKKMFGNKRQFPLSTLVDDLSKELDIVFVVSAGNIAKDYLDTHFPANYPNYLLENVEDVKIIDPASSTYAITVGSIAQSFGPVALHNDDLPFSPANTHFPSPFTCVGPGYKSMIKPELVEEGGNIILTPSDPARMENVGGKLIVLNPNWVKDGRLFTLECGTSLSAPKVAYYFGQLFNAFPDRTANLVKALLISSSYIPDDRPETLKNINYSDSSDNDISKLQNVYGYGKPNVNFSLSSEMNHVLLLAENQIKLDAVQLYYFHLPPEFIQTSGEKQISATLVYNPPIKRSRMDYFGVHMEYHLFQDSTIEELQAGYSSINIGQETEDIVPTSLKIKEIKLKPGVRTRIKGIHQKGIKSYVGKPRIDTSKPLILAVISKSKWLGNGDPDYTQDYSVVVSIKHQAGIDLYNLIQQQVIVPTRIRVRSK